MRNRNTRFANILFVLTCFGLLPAAKAVETAAPDVALAGGNTADGQNALAGLTTGTYNSAFGIFSLLNNGAANFNTGVGAGTLLLNVANDNTAVGAGALLSDTGGGENTANGAFALFSNTTGGDNSAFGFGALESSTTGNGNTAVGAFALSNTTGFGNTAIGASALGNEITGSDNIALGIGAGINVNSAENVICIGVPGADVDNSCYIGNIFGHQVDPATGTAVFVDTNGKLGTMVSSRRFKHDIKPMDESSEAILALKPVTFHYKNDKTDTPQYGLIAEQVAKVNPNLVVHDKHGETYTVRYDQVNAMLLNEFLKEHRKVQEQEATITQLTKDFGATIAQVTTRLDEQAAQIQKVSAQLEASKATSQVVNNP